MPSAWAREPVASTRSAAVRKRKDFDIRTPGVRKKIPRPSVRRPPQVDRHVLPFEIHAKARMGVACGVHVRSIALIFCVLAASAVTPAANLTAQQAYDLVVQMPWVPKPPPKPDDLAAARKALEGAMAKEPASARWPYALGHVSTLEARSLQGDAGEKKREEAVDLFMKATELDPKNADYQYWLGD